jgi:secondary thiamine-phosphate synthase enzyme
MNIIEIRTKKREEIVDITREISDHVTALGCDEGICTVFVPHTTAGVTINENADPDVKTDILMALQKAVPDALPYAHGEGNSPAHVKASLVGSSVSVIVVEGRLQLGTWQGICLCEFDGPRTREVWISISGNRT